MSSVISGAASEKNGTSDTASRLASLLANASKKPAVPIRSKSVPSTVVSTVPAPHLPPAPKVATPAPPSSPIKMEIPPPPPPLIPISDDFVTLELGGVDFPKRGKKSLRNEPISPVEPLTTSEGESCSDLERPSTPVHIPRRHASFTRSRQTPHRSKFIGRSATAAPRTTPIAAANIDSVATEMANGVNEAVQSLDIGSIIRQSMSRYRSCLQVIVFPVIMIAGVWKFMFSGDAAVAATAATSVATVGGV